MSNIEACLPIHSYFAMNRKWKLKVTEMLTETIK